MLMSIQYLRALAALLVTALHLFMIYFPDAQVPLSFGQAGVDIFFVISGFIMWHITRDKAVSAGEFLRHRIIRIVPMYWLVTMLYVVAATLKPNLFAWNQPEAWHVVLSLFFIPHMNAATSEIGPLVLQGWTLEYEALFYIFFAISLCLAKRLRFAALSVMVLTPVALGLLFQPSNVFLKWLTFDVLAEFYFGILIALMLEKKILLPKLAAAGAMIVAAALIAGSQELIGVLPRSLHWGAPAALLVWSAISLERSGNLIKSKTMLLLGGASYSLYLVHHFAPVAVSIVLGPMGAPQVGVIPFLAAFACAIGGGIFMFLWIERPFLSYCRRYMRPSHPAATSPA